MTRDELYAGQAEARVVTRTAYVHRMVRFQGLPDPVLVMPSGEAYVRTYTSPRNGVRHEAGLVRVGTVTQVGQELHLVTTRKPKGKAARRAQKRARQRARVAGGAVTSTSDGQSNGRCQPGALAAPPAPSMGGRP